jgi:predicted dehydrogenase
VGTGVEIYGTEGHLIWLENEYYVELARDFDGKMFHYRRTAGKNPVVRLDTSTFKEKADQLQKEDNPQRTFARAVLAGAPAPVGGEIGLRDVAITQAIYRAAEKGGKVQVRDLLQEA